ncbi:hypothetical protein Emag_003040 [Eimeria magna]
MQGRGSLREKRPPHQPTLLLLHHLEPPLEWREALSVLRAALGAPPPGEVSEQRYKGPLGAPSCGRPPFNPAKLQQLLVDIQRALQRGLSQRDAFTQGGAPSPASGQGGHHKGPPSWGPLGGQQQRILGPLPRPRSSSYRGLERQFAVVPDRAKGPFFHRALPLMLEACVAADAVFPRCTYSTHSAGAAAAAAAPAAAAAAVGGDEASPPEGDVRACSCGSCRLRLQLSRYCSSGACLSSSSSSSSRSSRSSSRTWGSHALSCAAELSAGEGWVLFSLGFLGLLPPPYWQEIATGSPHLGDLSFSDFFGIATTGAAAAGAARPAAAVASAAAAEAISVRPVCCRYCCCMAAAVEAFHAKCLLRGLGPFSFSPPHLAALCCEETQPAETARTLSAMLDEEVRCLLMRETAAATPAARAAAAAAAAAADSPVVAAAARQEGDSADRSSCAGAPCSSCRCGVCSHHKEGLSCLVRFPAGGDPPGEGPWPVAFPCCFVLRSLRFSRAQAGGVCSNSETLALQQAPLLPPEVIEEAVDGGGIPCSESLDVRADFANAVIGGGVLYHASHSPCAADCFAAAASAALSAACAALFLLGLLVQHKSKELRSLQEEVFFSVSPELLLLRPLSQHLGPGEAAHCWGSLRFSDFKGYAQSFRCCLNAEKGDSRSGEETPSVGSVSKQQQHETPQNRKPHQGLESSERKRPLLPLDSDDEEGDCRTTNKETPLHAAREAAAAAAATGATGAVSASAAAAGDWGGWAGTEGVEAVDRTPLRVQWLSPRWGPPVRGPTSGGTPAERGVGGPLWVRVETASIVAALDARQYGSSSAARGAAAAAEALGAARGLHSSSAAARQYAPCQMLRELQKVCAALHLPLLQDEETAAAATTRKETLSLLRPFTTGNWGCGFFGGDPQLKFLLQWIGASLCGRSMRYFAWGLPALLQRALLYKVIVALLEGPPTWTCGRLWKVLLEGSMGSSPPLRAMGVFSYVLHRAAGAAVAAPLPLDTPAASMDIHNSSRSSSRGGSSKRDREWEDGERPLSSERSHTESNNESPAAP